MALQLSRGSTHNIGKVIASSFAIMAIALQPLVSLNLPAVFAVSGSTIAISGNADLQTALANQADGQTWQLAPGTYDQQMLHITKAITIVGPTNGSAVLKAPLTMTNGGKLVDIDSTGVILNHLTISGTVPATSCGDDVYGVYFENGASATIENSSITDIRDSNPALLGCQQGIAVRVGSQHAGISASATIKNVTVSGYQKGGIVVDGNGSSAVITNSTVTGAGAINYIAQNGIQVSRGATATIKNNAVTGNSYVGADYAAGLLLYGAGDHTVVSGNTITGNQVGYYTETQANLKYLDMSGISGNTRNAIAYTDASYNPAWIQPSATWADASISGQANADGNDIVSTGGKLHVYGYDAFTTVPRAVQAVSANGTVNFGSDQTTTSQVTLTKKVTLNGNGHVLLPNFTKTDNDNNSALGIQVSGVVVKNLIEDGTHGTNLHGINVTGAVTGVSLSGVTVKNNNHSGLNVNASKVTVTNLTTAHNGWNGVDVDKTGAVLTVKGVSHHDETAADIYVDNTSVGKVVDTNNQYDFANNVKQAGDRVYDLKLAAPTNLTPTEGTLTSDNKFNDTWSVVPGAASYNYEVSASSSNGSLGALIWSDNSRTSSNYNVANGIVTRANGKTDDGTYYWRVQAVDANGIAGPWSAIQKVTIDATAPAQPTGLHYYAVNDHQDYIQSGLVITRQAIYPRWGAVTQNVNGDAETIDHYNYQSKGGYTTTINGTDASTNSTIKNWVPPVDVADGFRVQAVDTAGNVSTWSSWMYVDFDSTAPVAQITAPSSSDILRGTVTVSGTVTDANPDHYYFVVKNSQGTVVAGPGVVNQAQVTSWSWNTNNVADGTYTIDLEARDKAGNKDASSTQTLTVTVDNTAPHLAITTYTVNGDGTYTVAGTTDDNSANVIVSIGLNNITVTPVNGHWSVNVGAIADGTYSVVATTTDAAGNTTQISQRHTFSTPISQTQQQQGVLPAGPGATNRATTVVLGTTPTGQVLGTQTTTPQGQTSNGQDVKGVSTTKDTNGTDNKSNGFAWYWWVVILAVIAAFLWWLIAARRRKQAGN